MEIQLVDCEQCGTTVISYHLVKGGFKLCDSCKTQQDELNHNDDLNNATHACWFQTTDGVRSDLFMGSEDAVFEQFFSDYHQLATEDAKWFTDTDQDIVEEAFFLGHKEFKKYTIHGKIL